MLENIRVDSGGSIPHLRMPSLLPHDLCPEWNASAGCPCGVVLRRHAAVGPVALAVALGDGPGAHALPEPDLRHDRARGRGDPHRIAGLEAQPDTVGRA